MMRAYNECYLNDAMRILGEAVEYAVCECRMEIDEFFDLFITSGIANYFGKGVPKYVAGMTGMELVDEIFFKTGYHKGTDCPPVTKDYSLSAEYWCGWSLALYQWFSGNSYMRIIECIDGNTLARMYPSLHEAPEQKVIESMNNIIKRKNNNSKLQEMRKVISLSQSELAKKSGVNLRTLQQYEIKSKNINKASVSTLIALSRTLGCRIEDIMEGDFT